MLGIVVVLAIVAAVFAFGTGSLLTDAGPSAHVTAEYDSETNNMVLVHDGGEPFSESNTGSLEVHLTGSVQGTATGDEWVHPALESGTELSSTEAEVTGSVRASEDIWDSSAGGAAGNVEEGDTIEIVWVSADGDSSFTVAEFTASSA